MHETIPRFEPVNLKFCTKETIELDNKYEELQDEKKKLEEASNFKYYMLEITTCAVAGLSFTPVVYTFGLEAIPVIGVAIASSFVPKKINDYKRKKQINSIEKQMETNREEYKELQDHLNEEYRKMISSPNYVRCFVKGTPVYTKDGNKPIEEVKKGDLVYSFNGEEPELKEVLNTFQNQSDSLMSVVTEEGQIDVTKKHRFWVNKDWVEAGNLKIGDMLTSPEGLTAVIDLKELNGIHDVHNLEVNDNHNYYVGKQRVLVHNESSIIG